MMNVSTVSMTLDDGDAPRMELELRTSAYNQERYTLLTIESGTSDIRIYMTEEQGMAMAVLHGIAVQDRTTKQSTQGTEQE